MAGELGPLVAVNGLRDAITAEDLALQSKDNILGGSCAKWECLEPPTEVVSNCKDVTFACTRLLKRANKVNCQLLEGIAFDRGDICVPLVGWFSDLDLALMAGLYVALNLESHSWKEGITAQPFNCAVNAQMTGMVMGSQNGLIPNVLGKTEHMTSLVWKGRRTLVAKDTVLVKHQALKQASIYLAN
jgi:hypothetical protein